MPHLSISFLFVSNLYNYPTNIFYNPSISSTPLSISTYGPPYTTTITMIVLGNIYILCTTYLHVCFENWVNFDINKICVFELIAGANQIATWAGIVNDSFNLMIFTFFSCVQFPLSLSLSRILSVVSTKILQIHSYD